MIIIKKETKLTLSRSSESLEAIEHDVVVFPTPPLPPTNIHFKDFRANRELNDGSKSFSRSK